MLLLLDRLRGQRRDREPGLGHRAETAPLAPQRGHEEAHRKDAESLYPRSQPRGFRKDYVTHLLSVMVLHNVKPRCRDDRGLRDRRYFCCAALADAAHADAVHDVGRVGFVVRLMPTQLSRRRGTVQAGYLTTASAVVIAGACLTFCRCHFMCFDSPPNICLLLCASVSSAS